MAGIVSYGAYIPLHRISRAEIARAWGNAPLPGERAVAGYDEDSLTMGFAATADCLLGIDKSIVDGLYFASTTSPYKEKQSATTLATVLGLKNDISTIDFGGSLRCATNALKAALDAVRSGSARNILVCCAENRLGYPAGPSEIAFGDGAAALLIGTRNTLAEVEGFGTRYNEIQDIWRSDKDTFVRNAEDRFATDEGYIFTVSDCITSLLKNQGLSPRDFSQVAIYAPNTRPLFTVIQKLGFDKAQCSDKLHTSVGDAGSAMAIMELIERLEQSHPNERILLAGYGNGCDSFVIKTTGSLGSLSPRGGIARYLNSKSLLSGYGKYLRWRELVQIQPPSRPPIELRQPTPSAQWREDQWELRLTGSKCLKCGTPQYPRQRVCINCHTKDQFEPYTFFDKPAKVFSFSHDFVMQTADPPVTLTMVDFEGGGRLMCDMTDRDPAAVKVGMPLQMTFRRLYYVGGIFNYWWKCQPLRF
jgi:hydroxymethylglutaryl-CoA synthase